MRFFAVATAMLAALTVPAGADPSTFLAPDDPESTSGWRPPPPVTAGLAIYKPVKPKDWLELRPKGADPAGSMSTMPGMKGMPEMGDGK